VFACLILFLSSLSINCKLDAREVTCVLNLQQTVVLSIWERVILHCWFPANGSYESYMYRP